MRIGLFFCGKNYWDRACILSFLISVALASAWSLKSGIFYFTLSDIYNFLFAVHQSKSFSSLVFWELRLPRIMAGVLGGSALALSGWLIQEIVKNPIASPNLTGVMPGGALLVMLVEVYQLDIPLLIAGMSGGFLGGFTVLAISWRNGLRPERLVLTGVAVGIFFQAVISGVLLSERVDGESMSLWLVGSLAATQWSDLQIIFGTLSVSACVLWLFSGPLDQLKLDDAIALSIGVPLNTYRIVFGFIALCLTAACVGAFGPIGFVGLVAPHLARILNLNLWHAAPLGSFLLVVSDAIARTVLSPLELSVGVVMSLIGSPWLIFLVVYRYGRHA